MTDQETPQEHEDEPIVEPVEEPAVEAEVEAVAAEEPDESSSAELAEARLAAAGFVKVRGAWRR